jgi:hypothetical protein
MRVTGLYGFAAAAGMAAALVAAPAASHAAVLFTFAEFSQLQGDNSANIFWSNPGTGTGSLFTGSFVGGRPVAGSVPVQFSFLDKSLGVNDVSAALTLTATSTAPATSVGVFDQGGIGGSFSIIYKGAADLVIDLIHYKTGANLLSGTFTKGNLAGGSSSGGFFVSTLSGNVISFTSAIKGALSGSLPLDIALNIDSIAPVLGIGPGGLLKSFHGNAGGNFAQGVPEPATWAMMIIGFGAIGFAARRRRLAAA